MSKTSNNVARRLRVAILFLLLPMVAMAQSDFVVRDMRVEGLQRISEGTVFNYLPINIGDRVDKIRVQEAIRALYRQGLSHYHIRERLGSA